MQGIKHILFQVPKGCYLSELHQQLGKVVRSNPTTKLPVMEDEAEDPKVSCYITSFRCFNVTNVDFYRFVITNYFHISAITNVLGKQMGRLFRQIWIRICIV